MTLEIQARVPGGVPDSVVRTVSENCRTLKFNNQHFEKNGARYHGRPFTATIRQSGITDPSATLVTRALRRLRRAH